MIDLLLKRHSVRKYSPQRVAPDIINKLNAAITSVNTHEAGMHFQLFTDDPEPFRGFTRSYGMLSGVRNYIAAVADTSFAHWRQRAGFCGMEIVMKATGLGLGTCFVSGTFSAANVAARVRAGERLLFLITFGYEDHSGGPGIIASLTSKIAHRKKMTAEDFIISSIPTSKLYHDIPLLSTALDALAHSPSALNKRPTRMRVERNNEGGYMIEASVPAGNEAYEIDLGIALYSIQSVMPGYWDWGNPAIFHAESE